MKKIEALLADYEQAVDRHWEAECDNLADEEAASENLQIKGNAIITAFEALEAEITRLTAENQEREAVYAALAAEHDKQRWIPVSERLPEDNQKAWWWDSNKEDIVSFAYYYWLQPIRKSFTHWKPYEAIEPPAPESEER